MSVSFSDLHPGHPKLNSSIHVAMYHIWHNCPNNMYKTEVPQSDYKYGQNNGKTTCKYHQLMDHNSMLVCNKQMITPLRSISLQHVLWKQHFPCFLLAIITTKLQAQWCIIRTFPRLFSGSYIKNSFFLHKTVYAYLFVEYISK